MQKMSSGSLKNVINKMCLQIIFLVYLYKEDLALNNHLELICRKPQPTKETVTVIMMLYRNTKAKVHSSDGDIGFFDIVPGVFQGDKLSPYLFIICLNYVLWTSIDLISKTGLH